MARVFSIRFGSAFALGVALVVGCVPVRPPAQSPDSEGAADTLAPPPGIPPAISPLLALSGTVEGALRAGEPFVIVARVEALKNVDSMELTVVLPEVSDARESGWGADFTRRPAGVRYPALDSVVARLRAGEHVERRIPLTIPVPGWYMVSLVARDRGTVLRNEPVAREAFLSFYLWIGEETGTVAAAADLTRYPPDAAMQTGPVLGRPGPNRVRQQILQAQTAPGTFAAVAGVVRTARGDPVPHTTVTIRGYRESCPGPPVSEERVTTNASGSYRALLRAWPAEAFTGCISVLVDPARAWGLRAGAARATTSFATTRPDRPVRIDVTLESIPPDS